MGPSLGQGEFLELPEFDMDSLLAAWQDTVFSLVLSEGKIESEVVEKLLNPGMAVLFLYSVFTVLKSKLLSVKLADRRSPIETA